jgi:signal transduction histidine kinase
MANYADTIIKLVSGPMRGTEYPARSESMVLGRSTEADVQIHDPLISRLHCKLTWDDGKWYLEDLSTTNGTWMVGQKVDKRVNLPLKTSVRIGNTILELHNIYAGDTLMLQRPFIAYRIQPETLAPSMPGLQEGDQAFQLTREENKRLAAIYKFQNLIAAVFDEKELYQKILRAVANVIPSDEAYLLIFDINKGEFMPVAGLTAKDGITDKVNRQRIRDTIVDFVKENREAVLSIDADEDRPRLTGLQGLPKITSSTMCAPMLGKQINGMLYLSLTSATEKYSEDDLRLLTVIGHTAGMAVENSRLVEFNLKNERLVATGSTAAGLSHYIKNILAGLDGSLNLLRMGIDEKDLDMAGEAWDILQKNHRRLGNLVLDLLNLASDQKPDFKIHNLSDIIRDVMELCESQLKQEGIALEVGADILELPLFAEVDAKGIHRVLLNLINNSEHAVLTKQESARGKKTGIGAIRISAKFSENKEYITVSVTDDGVGVSKEDLSSMFELFISTKGMAGSGLGLTVSKRIIKAHEGTVSASSEKGKGCTIAFTIPVSHNEATTVTRSINRVI